MYCENCGHKLGDKHLFCEECGNKVQRPFKDKTNDKTLWIILGCVFGVPLLIGIIIFLISFFIIIDNVSTIEEIDDYDINEYYDYEKVSSSYFYNDENVEVIKIK